MRKFRILILVAAAVLALGCKKDKNVPLDITGVWELTDIQTKSVNIGAEVVEIVITFNADNTFSLSQKIGSEAGRPDVFTGVWQLTDRTLSGKYSDGKSWGATYEISVEGTVLTMTPDVSDAETYIYHKK